LTTEVPLPRSRAYTGPFLAPATQIFDKFCSDLVQRYGLQGHVRAAFVERLDLVRAEHNDEAFLVRLHYREPDCPNSEAKLVYARRVVLALGPGQPRWPTWARSSDDCQPLPGCFHADDFFSQRTPPPAEWKGKSITVVGGGITAVQWAILAVESGT
jgi:cation diffusion facilitator CzcD-associated flavoprotein CzcO